MNVPITSVVWRHILGAALAFASVVYTSKGHKDVVPGHRVDPARAPATGYLASVGNMNSGPRQRWVVESIDSVANLGTVTCPCDVE